MTPWWKRIRRAFGKWINKFGKKNNVSTSIEGVHHDHLIANNFAKFFASSGNQTNNFSRQSPSWIDIEYKGDSSETVQFDVELVDRFINATKRGKAAGLDNLTIEHLLYSHPIIIYCYYY